MSLARTGRRRAAAAALTACATVAATFTAVSAAPAGAAPSDADAVARATRAFASSATPEAGLYTVVLKTAPSSAYSGGVRGYSATAPKSGGEFRSRSADVQRYESLLQRQQDGVLSRVGNPRTIYRFATALNGFTADLSSAQVVALRKDPSVLVVHKDQRVQADTVHTPDFLGMSGKKGVWNKFGGTKKAGKGVVVGVLDTGIWPENKSFAGADAVPNVPGFYGTCQAGEEWSASTCNSKVIGARYYNEAITEGEDGELAEAEYDSPRDINGHGSHTASTAAGNHDVKMTIEGQDFGRGSGMAPAAKIAVYKVLWDLETGNDGGVEADINKAVDDAVRDGVDVINYSIGSAGGGDPFTDPTNLAFMNAATAGIFVAVSAGNSGPDANTVGNIGPWLTTTAASTSYNYQGSVKLGNGEEYVGAMVSDDSVPSSPLKYAGDVVAEGQDPDDGALCGPGTLDEAEVAGAIIACDRGVFARTDKSAEVARAGGVGMVLLNVSPNSLDADFHSVPTVHLNPPEADAVYEYTQEPGATAALDANGADDTPVPQIAEFSSRGPATAGGGDIIKPDIAAPGSSIVAAVSPPGNSGRKWDLYSGTSMASPHIAGLAAFIHRIKPHWSPMMVKSAMMTTAFDLKGDNSPFTQGAGHVRPKRFLDPGLVFDARGSDWLNFLSGQGVVTADGDPITPTPIDASDLNMPSIGIGDLVGVQTVQRRLTNVSDRKETYTISSTGLAGVDVTPGSETVTIGAGRTRTVELQFASNGEVEFSEFAEGKLVFTGDRGHVVRIPLSVKPEPLVADEEVAGTVPAGEVEVEGVAGFTGEVDLVPSGLEGSTTVEDSLTPGEFDPADPQEDADTFLSTVTVADGDAVRFRADGDPQDDLDMFVYYEGTLVGVSATGSADEQVTGFDLPPGEFEIYVNAYDADGPTAALRYDEWVVTPGADAGNLTLDPDPLPVVSGEPFSYTASWTGLDEAQNWFGFVDYEDTGIRTIVQVD